jgi:hypothetical protein
MKPVGRGLHVSIKKKCIKSREEKKKWTLKVDMEIIVNATKI